MKTRMETKKSRKEAVLLKLLVVALAGGVVLAGLLFMPGFREQVFAATDEEAWLKQLTTTMAVEADTTDSLLGNPEARFARVVDGKIVIRKVSKVRARLTKLTGDDDIEETLAPLTKRSFVCSGTYAWCIYDGANERHIAEMYRLFSFAEKRPGSDKKLWILMNRGAVSDEDPVAYGGKPREMNLDVDYWREICLLNLGRELRKQRDAQQLMLVECKLMRQSPKTIRSRGVFRPEEPGLCDTPLDGSVYHPGVGRNV